MVATMTVMRRWKVEVSHSFYAFLFCFPFVLLLLLRCLVDNKSLVLISCVVFLV